MKKIGLFGAILMMSLSYSCTNESRTLQENSLNKELRKISDYAYLGDIHNKVMSYAAENFQENEKIHTADEAIQYIGCWASNSIDLFVDEPILYKDEFKLYDDNINANLLKMRLRRGETRAIQDISATSFENNEVSLDEAILVARESNAIDDFEAIKLREIGDKLLMNAEGILSNEDLRTYLLNVAGEWEQEVYDVTSETGQVLGMTLAISLASLEYWETILLWLKQEHCQFLWDAILLELPLDALSI